MKFCAAVCGVVAVASAANAGVITSYNLNGAPGDQAFTAGSAAANTTALNLTRGAGLTASTGGNSFSATGWTQQATDFFSFGFTVNSGFSANLDKLYIGTRSSNTGPGTMGLFYSGDGFATALTTFNQAPGSNFVNSIIDLSALTGLTGTVEFRIRQIGNTAANGGSTSSSGAFRVTAYFENGAFNRDLQLTGEVVPAPSALALLGLGGLVAARRRR